MTEETTEMPSKKKKNKKKKEVLEVPSAEATAVLDTSTTAQTGPGSGDVSKGTSLFRGQN